MQPPKSERRLRLAFRGASFQDGAVPVTLLAAKLQALQNLLFHAAAAVKQDTAARRGLWFNRYRDIAELTFAGSHQSELVIDVEVARAAVLGAEVDQGERTLDLVFDVANSVQHDFQGFEQLDLRKDDRAYLLRALDGLLPNPLDDYRLELENCASDKHPRLVLTPETKAVVRRYLLRETPPPISERVTLVGELIKIHVDVGPEKIAIRYGGREIDCFYPDSLRDQVANLLAGSMVEVTGEATLDSRGEVKKLDTVLDVSTVNMEPLRILRFEHAGSVFPLKKPLVVDVAYKDGLWVYHSGAINLWGYGERREDALRDLHENFAYLWQEFAEEDDALLDDHARRIKQVLLDIVDKQPAGV